MPIHTVDQAKMIVDKALAAIGDLATLPQVTIKIIEIVENHLLYSRSCLLAAQQACRPYSR